jgi:hypothetical protein
LILAMSLNAADFSHSDHLGFGLTCTQCHVAAPTSTRVQDNNLPRPEACRSCHAEVSIKTPRLTALEHFSHAQHVKNMDCEKCHPGGGTFPQMAMCVTCHVQGDIPNGCWQCHSQTMQLKPVTHLKDFVDTHNRVKRSVDQKATCRVCHGPNFRCAGCH